MTSKSEAVLDALYDSFTNEVLLHSANVEGKSNSEVFSDVYHSLIHAPEVSSTIVQLEHTNAEVIRKKCQQRDHEIHVLEDRQAKEMEEAVTRTTNDDAETSSINRLASQHMEEREMSETKWESDLAHTRDTQKREFREWVMCVHQEINDQEKRKNNAAAQLLHKSESAFSIDSMSVAPILQESFTITLGAQMKQMHNLRLVAADAVDLCRFPDAEEDALPKRLQTDMSIYSSNLCGIVLMHPDNRLSTYSSDMARRISRLCQSSTEYHFQNFEHQLQTIREDHVDKVLQWRQEHKRKKQMEEVIYGLDPNADESISSKYKNDSNKYLRKGDVFITKHSNLCEVHVLFHLIYDADDPVSSSRHPVVLGLRHVLKTASLSEVTTVTLPLLLAHEMSEEMTVAWCMKRAELVFKCVKGFMMEVASWGGAEIKTLQFLVPKDIDREVFNKLTSMLTSIFRTSNPIRGR